MFLHYLRMRYTIFSLKMRVALKITYCGGCGKANCVSRSEKGFQYVHKVTDFAFTYTDSLTFSDTAIELSA